MPDPIRIGDLRWQVTLAKRNHEPDMFDAENPELQDVYTDRVDVFANITPVGTAAYLAGKQLEIGAVTHRVTIRWRDTLSNMHVVLRTNTLPDGTTREDVYRIHRTSEWEGKHRFLILDVELEKRDAQAPNQP